MNGYLEIIIGPMYSGKTTSLIRKYEEIIEKQEEAFVINYSDDQRYHNTKLSTHDLKMIDCIQTKCLNDLDCIEEEHILINECQFFSDLYEFVENQLSKEKKIYLYGLDGDFKRKKFGQTLDLIPLCDKILKIKANCNNCENKAIFSHRNSQESQQVLIGNDIYEPLCRGCYFIKNN